MQYLELILSCAAAGISLAVFGYNLLKKQRAAANYTLALAGITSAALFIIMAIAMAAPGLIPAAAARRAELSLLMIIAALFFCFVMVYPYLKPKTIALTAAACLPAAAISAVVIVTGAVVTDPDGALALDAGYPVYCAVITIYLAAALAVTVFKIFEYGNRALRYDLTYLLAGMGIFFAAFLAASIYYPYEGISGRFAAIGTLVAYPSTLVIMNYAAIDVKTIDIRKFFATAFYWVMLLALLFVPAFLTLTFNSTEYLEEPVPPLAVAVSLFVYLFLVFKYLRPRLEILSMRGYHSLVARVDGLFSQQASGGTGTDTAQEDYLRALVNGIAEKFDISSAHLYLSMNNDKKFSVTHGVGSRITDTQITLAGPLADLIGRNPGILYKPSIYSEENFRPYRDGVKDYFERNHVEVILPFLNPERQIIGFLTLGQLGKNRAYSKAMIEVLELYRIQFQQQLANALLLERVRAAQVLDHDQMVVSSVKKRIMPQRMGQLENFRIGSFYINNSPYGGDYFDSVPVGDGALALFLSDSSYSGIDSAIILLELYTVLHTPSKTHDAPDRILGAMNWAVATSRFSSKYASAYCALLSPSGVVTYSNAACTPLIMYNPMDNSFTACDTTGVPVGVDRGSRYESKTIRLAPGSIGILCSDGLISSINPQGQTYGLDRVRNVLKSGRSRGPSELARILYDDLNRFTGDKKQINDVSVILFRYK